MIPKIIETDPYLVSKKGTIEKTVMLLHPSTLGHTKIASEALEYSKSISPKPGKTYILVLAMGASEFYGPNRNGDAFRESELKKHHHTFKTNANVFRSHVNKDPAKAIGKVVESFYNDDMHRVELILELDNSLASGEVEKVRSQKDLAVSMGCRIKYDVCTICGNKAPTRADYCKHLKYELGDIYPDGRIVSADNPNPKFFDISIVFRPADKTGYMLKKVAKAGGIHVESKSSDLAIKNASLTVLASYLNKAADIDKTIAGVAVGLDASDIETKELPRGEKELSAKWIKSITPSVVAAYKSIDESKLDSLSHKSFVEALNLLSKSGVFLMTPEFLTLLFKKLLGTNPPEGLATKLVSLQKDIFRVLAKHPEIPAAAIEDGTIPSDSSNMSKLDKEARYSISGDSGGGSNLRITRGMCKAAGLSAILNSAYIATLVEGTESSTDKLAHLVDVEIPSIPTEPRLSKLSYLEHRTIDLYKNHGNFIKLSYTSALNDIDLFSKSPEDYYVNLGYELLTP